MRELVRDQRWIATVLALWAVPSSAQDKKSEEDLASQKPVTKVIRGRVVDEAVQPAAAAAR